MTCPHGEPDPSCCIDCLEGPPAKVAPNLLIRYTELGWCCEDCASAPPPWKPPRL